MEKKITSDDQRNEFELIEGFIVEEQSLGRDRRSKARRTEAMEEARLPNDVAILKGFHFRTRQADSLAELQRKIADAERNYMNRKMVCAKAAQVASADCRIQSTRVKEFFGKLHQSRQDQLRRRHQRSLKAQELSHRLKQTDPRIVALERQVANRIYHKKKADLNEMHMIQNIEEAAYLESMLGLLDDIQEGKENAARDMFELQVAHFSQQRENNERRSRERHELVAAATSEMTRLFAHFTDEEQGHVEEQNKIEEAVQATERRKDFLSADALLSVSELYDTVLWTVATSQLGLSTTGSSVYSSEIDSDDTGILDDDNDDDDLEWDKRNELAGGLYDKESTYIDDDGTGAETFPGETLSAQTSIYEGSSAGSSPDNELDRISLIGRIHVKRSYKEFRAKEKALNNKHKEEAKEDKKQYRAAVRSLRLKHRRIIENLVGKSMMARQRLRENITAKISNLLQKQEESTAQLREAINAEAEEMMEALRSEDQRVEDAERQSFAKAQTLISAQVFHEVRNALSSVISMSEMTASFKNDSSMSPVELASSVDEMLDQLNEVVHYALNMLNNILDVSKINTGQFKVNKKPFDLQKVVLQATKMQAAKAGHVAMKYVPSPQPCIVNSDMDIVMRIIVNFICNAVKFTSAGAVQPFIWNEDDLRFQLGDCNSDRVGCVVSCINSEDNSDLTQGSVDCKLENESRNDRKRKSNEKIVAVGVADTGPGLSLQELRLAQCGLASTDTVSMNGATKNSGFGLHLAHLLAKTLGTKLRLANLHACSQLLNEDMRKAMEQYELRFDRETSDCSLKDNTGDSDDWSLAAELSQRLPGPGTVLYITLPLARDDSSCAELSSLTNQQPLEEATASITMTDETDRVSQKYTFCPVPAPSSGGYFRILLADDVLILRKGMVHTITSIFHACPVSIKTACTAEDLLRCLAAEPFDLVISDHLFNLDSSQVTALPVNASPSQRPHLRFQHGKESLESLRGLISDFFRDEKFTVEKGDGKLTGFDAIVTAAQAHDAPFPTPVLMLLSGHKLEAPPDLGIIVAQKPLRRHDLIPLLEAHASKLSDVGRCVMKENNSDDDDTTSIYRRYLNRHGCQMFVSSES